MELIFLGSGSAFTMNNRQSNMLLKHNGKNLLIDCGTDVRHSIQQAGLSHRDIDAVYVSHLHADHVGGLEWLSFLTYFDPGATKPKLYIHRGLKTELWNGTLRGGLGSLQGQVTDLDTFFDTQSCNKIGTFEWEGIQFQMVQTVHIMDAFTIVPSFGLIFKLNEKTVFITTDTQFCPEQIKDFYAMADVIFQDCETSPFESGVHAHWSKLLTLDEDIKSKMWLYHHQDGELPDAKAGGFQGFVEKGQIFE
ncbi:MBL fold metallo-hydrolase [Candidatus Pacearchaeota archaeon]|nr:MBL fold metallo-hydrolase [Candidatus Pacearchaeota archaeon]